MSDFAASQGANGDAGDGEGDDGDLARLRARVTQLEAQVLRLSDECDLLAFENARLREQQASGGGGCDGPPEPATGDDSKYERDIGLLDPTDGRSALTLCHTLDGACGGKNVTCVRFLESLGDTRQFHRRRHRGLSPPSVRAEEVIAVGGADGALHIYRGSSDGAAHWRLATRVGLGAPVLCIDQAEGWVPDALILVVGLMDGKVALLRCESLEALPGVELRVELLGKCKIHRKYVTSIAAGVDGLVVSGSYDKDAVLSRFVPDAGDGDVLQEARRFFHSGEVECVGFHGREHFFVAARGASKIVCYAIEGDAPVGEAAGEESPVSLPLWEGQWEGPVNLNVMHFQVRNENLSQDLHVPAYSPLLLAATDASQHFLFDVRTKRRVRTFAGHDADGFSNPRVTWHGQRGQYVSSNSQHTNSVVTWEIGSGRMVGTKAGAHHGVIKSVYHHTHCDLLVTGGFDRTVKIWSFEEA
eukprot:CAMPEP_0118862710 /NCGR_PEP_ID=MMETSP1163-20130328/7825_1 /TAXON_ID=124430 /ORGANISM="Phaeomonas parva, Strain CCMP2877" /LENGTH=471 /DNA_ID=CAMNT_0006796641 /DNA_START=85 /DNA_END=1500 /DNA_ORIENTATION=-